MASLGEPSQQPGEKYRGLGQIRLNALIPVISSFQDQIVVGRYTRMADPLFIHDLRIETGFSNFRKASEHPAFHFKGCYTHRQKYHLELEYNLSNTYGLFNQRKAGQAGIKV